MDPSWEYRPYRWKVKFRSDGMFDYHPEYKKERTFWRGHLEAIADVLDKLHFSTQAMPEEAQLLDLAFDAFIVLVEPKWWREHPPQELTEAEEQRMIGLQEKGKLAQRRMPPGEWRSVEVLILAALETFYRARYQEGMEACTRLTTALVECLAEDGTQEPVN